MPEQLGSEIVRKRKKNGDFEAFNPKLWEGAERLLDEKKRRLQSQKRMAQKNRDSLSEYRSHGK